MTIEILRARIQDALDSSVNKTEQNRYTHHRAVLNTLIKKKITTEPELELALTKNLTDTETKLSTKLEAEGKNTRSPKSRLRSLAAFYVDVCRIETAKLTFAQTLQVAAKRKYGKKLWTGPVPRSKQEAILKTHKTYRQVAKDIISSAINECPEAWPLKEINSASKVLRDYFIGSSLPGPRIEDVRIHYIEDFFSLPRGILLKKASRRLDWASLGQKDSEKDQAAINRDVYTHKSLNKNLQLVLDEYTNLKTNDVQPTIKNMPENTTDSPFHQLRMQVREINSRENSKWTMNSLEIEGSANGLKNSLLGFINYCTDWDHVISAENGQEKEPISFEDVSTYHLTDPYILARMVQHCTKKKTGGSKYARVLNWIKRGSKKQGYLRLCGDKGDRSTELFIDGLEFILEEYPGWVKSCKKSVSKRVNGIVEGKKNVRFLTGMKLPERREAVYKASMWLLGQADSFYIQAMQSDKLGKESTRGTAKKRLNNDTKKWIVKALTHSRTAVVQEMAFINCLREGNLVQLKYYANAKAQDEGFSSITWLRQRNCFRLFVPTHGTSIVNQEKTERLRVLKNGESAYTTNIDVELPEVLTPLIQRYLEIRKEYIRITWGKEFEIDLLFPYQATLSRSKKAMPEIKKLRERFVEPPAKFGDTFRLLTYKAYVFVLPQEKQHGINLHGLRHLVTVTHLEEFPDDYLGAASKLNDSKAQIILTYGDNDRLTAMQRVANTEQIGSNYKYK